MVPALVHHNINSNPRRQLPGTTADNATPSRSSTSHICCGIFRALASMIEAAGDWMMLQGGP